MLWLHKARYELYFRRSNCGVTISSCRGWLQNRCRYQWIKDVPHLSQHVLKLQLSVLFWSYLSLPVIYQQQQSAASSCSGWYIGQWSSRELLSVFKGLFKSLLSLMGSSNKLSVKLTALLVTVSFFSSPSKFHWTRERMWWNACLSQERISWCGHYRCSH